MSTPTFPPEVIYLQWYAEDGEPALEVTWCEDRINLTDTGFVRLDKVKELIETLKKYADPEVWVEDTDPTSYPPLPYLTKNVFCPDPPDDALVYTEGENGGSPARRVLEGLNYDKSE